MENARQFGQPRPDADGPAVTVAPKARGNQTFQPLPKPTGAPPFHLNLADVLGADAVAEIEKGGRLVFHSIGDTGGFRYPIPQEIVARKMELQLWLPVDRRPAFFFHLGDVVYKEGAADQYSPQFYQPYEHYTAPIFAVPGNHDGHPQEPPIPSLDAFTRNFCSPSPVITRDADDVQRDAMTQPNCYFTLNAPFATVIGLYTNVPEGGAIEQEQRDWFAEELRSASKEKALFVALHHSPFSYDDHHGGSQTMRDALDAAFRRANRSADVVLSAHVHNYQRFTRRDGDRRTPYIVAGAGGYHHLRAMQRTADGRTFPIPYEIPGEPLTLEHYEEDRHGFLRVTVDSQTIECEYFVVPRPQESWSEKEERRDFFRLNWRSGTYVS